jgi:hypothetical protein
VGTVKGNDMLKSEANLLVALISFVGFGTVGTVAAEKPAVPGNSNANRESVIFFVADGMRQDTAESYAANGLMPTMAKLLRSGARAADGGLLTHAPAPLFEFFNRIDRSRASK